MMWVVMLWTAVETEMVWTAFRICVSFRFEAQELCYHKNPRYPVPEEFFSPNKTEPNCLAPCARVALGLFSVVRSDFFPRFSLSTS